MALSRSSIDGWRDGASAYAALVRVPNLFTAPPDVLLGATLATGSLLAAPRTVAALALASVLLYAAGTALNDAFDAPADARERPERPIPSGEVARRTAFAVGAGLLLAGVAVALLGAGPSSGGVAAMVAVGILLYDGGLKGSVAGFLNMGAIRGLNVVLGATAGASFLGGATAGTTPLVGGAGASIPGRASALGVLVPLVVTTYIAAVTYMAARETEGGARSAVAVAAAGVGVGVVAIVGVVLVVRPAPVGATATLGLGAAFLWWTGRPLLRAYGDPVPARVGPAVGACVLGLVLLDAALAAAVDPVSGAVAVAFLLPAVGLSRAFDVT